MSKYEIEFSKKARKSFKKLPQNIQSVILQKIDKLIFFDYDMQNIKKLKGQYKELYRLRVGDYRILFQVKNQKLIIIIIDILPRSRSYSN